MGSHNLVLATAPSDPRRHELWLQHAVGRILIEDVRGYAVEQINPTLTPEARAAAMKGIDDALYGLMRVIDGVSGSRRGRHVYGLPPVARRRLRG